MRLLRNEVGAKMAGAGVALGLGGGAGAVLVNQNVPDACLVDCGAETLLGGDIAPVRSSWLSATTERIVDISEVLGDPLPPEPLPKRDAKVTQWGAFDWLPQETAVLARKRALLRTLWLVHGAIAVEGCGTVVFDDVSGRLLATDEGGANAQDCTEAYLAAVVPLEAKGHTLRIVADSVKHTTRHPTTTALRYDPGSGRVFGVVRWGTKEVQETDVTSILLRQLGYSNVSDKALADAASHVIEGVDPSLIAGSHLEEWQQAAAEQLRFEIDVVGRSMEDAIRVVRRNRMNTFEIRGADQGTGSLNRVLAADGTPRWIISTAHHVVDKPNGEYEITNGLVTAKARFVDRVPGYDVAFLELTEGFNGEAQWVAVTHAAALSPADWRRGAGEEMPFAGGYSHGFPTSAATASYDRKRWVPSYDFGTRRQGPTTRLLQRSRYFKDLKHHHASASVTNQNSGQSGGPVHYAGLETPAGLFTSSSNVPGYFPGLADDNGVPLPGLHYVAGTVVAAGLDQLAAAE